MILRVDVLLPFLEEFEGDEGEEFLLLDPLSEGEVLFVWFLGALGAPEKKGGAAVAGGCADGAIIMLVLNGLPSFLHN